MKTAGDRIDDVRIGHQSQDRDRRLGLTIPRTLLARSSGAALGIDWCVLAGLDGYKIVHMTAKDNVKTLPEYDEMLLKDRRPTSDRVKPVDRLLRCMSPEMAPGGRSRMSAMRSGFDGKPDLRLIWFEDLV